MIYRIDVRTAPAARGGEAAVDPLGEAVRHQIEEFGTRVGPILTARVFLIDTDASREQVQRAATELLADPVVESADLILSPAGDNGKSRIEIHLKPGVMDPVAASTEMALRDMGLKVNEVRTGRAYLIDGSVAREELQRIAGRVLANGVIESVHFDAFIPREFSKGRQDTFQVRHVELRKLTDEQLTKLSREGHLFLSLAEMKAIHGYYREQGREPTDIELETLAQTWSEHCVHKTLKSAVDVEVQDADGKLIGTRRYGNLIKETVFKATADLTRGGADKSFCLSVFADNAGVIAFDDTDAVCFKVETHNHPSAIEPYGGSATGAGGVIRDILGTGLAARPIANTDVFCVAHTFSGGPEGQAHPRAPDPLPKGVIHPKRILQQVVAGVRDYGNRMGIPTLNGAVYFDNGYLGNPLVFCGCVGLIPRDKIDKAARPGDAIVVMGGRTGRDGIHGATFSSAELTDTHADEFSHAVQIGNAITEKKMADVILQARDLGLFTAITDCGAGGLSSAVGEMGAQLGARVELDRVPLKYAGLRYDEIWISEAQERMVLSVPRHRVEELLKLARGEDVEATVIGEFGTPRRELLLNYRGNEVGRLSMEFLHDGIPMPRRKAVIRGTGVSPVSFEKHGRDARDTKGKLLALLAHPNIASKHWIVRQYDHEVQGGSVIKPLVGPLQIGPSDASVIRPKLGSHRGVVIGCGLAPHVTDPYRMTIASIDEAIRNVVAVGADPARVAILDNFCWPSVDDDLTMGTLVRACEACYDAARAYGIPFISGKDSLHNQFTVRETGEVIRIPSTLLISAIGIVDDVRRCVTMDFKRTGNRVGLVRQLDADPELSELSAVHRRMADAIRRGLVVSCHDVSEGGPLVSVAEMCIASGLGADVRLAESVMFVEVPGCYVVEYAPEDGEELKRLFDAPRLTFEPCGQVVPEPRLRSDNYQGAADEVSVGEMTRAWRGTLDW
jgi:phosphoribosylformylglycinamidine synthase subunit PurSL